MRPQHLGQVKKNYINTQYGSSGGDL